MEPNTLRLPAETWEELSEEAEEHGFANRAEYVRNLIQRRQAIMGDYGENTTDESGGYEENTQKDETGSQENTLADVTKRLEAVADRLETATDESLSESVTDSEVNHSPRNTPVLSDASESPVSGSTTETMDTTRNSRNETGSTPSDGPDTTLTLSAEWILENAAWSDHEVTATPERAEALAEAHAYIRDHSGVTSGELAERLAEDDRVGLSEGTVRNHLLPVLGSLPGTVQPGNGQRKWAYEGDDVVRDALEPNG